MHDKVYRYRKVWDPLLRALHWWNAATLFVLIMLGTGLMVFGERLTPADRSIVEIFHALVGYAFAAGLLTRIYWLFAGPPLARWRDFLPLTADGRRALIDTLKYYVSGFRRESPLYLGHNPLAGVVYLVFFALALIVVISGVIVLEIPPDLRKNLWLTKVHETGYFLVLFYIAIHLPAVFLHEWGERQGLLGSMIHGCKTFTDEEWHKLTDDEAKAALKTGSEER